MVRVYRVAAWMVPTLLWCANPAMEPCATAVREAKYKNALQLCQEAAYAFAGVGDPGRAGVATNLLGHARLRLGDYDGARYAYEQSLNLARAAGDAEAVAQRFNNLGSVDYFLGRYEDAERRYKEAADWIEQHKGAKWSAELALGTAVNRAALLQRLRRDREALDLYLALRQSAHGLKRDDEGRLLANLGALYRSLGDPAKAIELYRSALDRFESPHGISGALKNLGIAEAVEFSHYGAARILFERVQVMARESGDQREGLLAELYLAETAFRERKTEEARERWDRSRAQAAKLGAAEEEWRALFGLGRVDGGASGEKWLRASIAKIEGIRQQASAGAQRTGFLADKRDVYDALLRQLFARGSVSDELLDTLERSRSRNVADQTFRITVPQTQALLEPGETLAVWWVTPVERNIVWLTRSASGVAKGMAEVPLSTRLVIVPDGGIEGEPIERGLPEKTEVVFLPAVRLLAASANRKPSTGLLVADKQLISAQAETDDVARLLRLDWKRQHDRASVLAGLSGAGVIHIAAHAEPDLEREERSRIRLADGPLVLGDVVKKKSMPELVTLAACETIRGRNARGEGVQSLASAFLRAGARSVVASRWPVQDSAARAFMQQFYAALAQGETKAGALRTAKLRLKQSGGELAKPEHWEAWILYGDGRGRLAEPPRSWMLLVAAAAALLLAGTWWKFSKGQRAA